ncbi:helix-turn-helix domain-containing protein [Ottowia thiooxydans]|uniref:helix-turn-helix domain-containing protein n=1 Tax=Ottowia thiooxydans TaxID=219182 RepID=UPI0003FBF795|nr:helix-turn-helix transcriptional regulator [Ottowia thiooxydans]
MSRSTHNSHYQLLLAVLKTARKRVGVSQVELAERLGNTQTFVSKCERGERRIDAVELVEFAEALGVPPQELLNEYLDQRSRNQFASSKKTRGRS